MFFLIPKWGYQIPGRATRFFNLVVLLDPCQNGLRSRPVKHGRKNKNQLALAKNKLLM